MKQLPRYRNDINTREQDSQIQRLKSRTLYTNASFIILYQPTSYVTHLTMGHSNSTLQSHQLSAGGIEKGIPPVIRVSYESGWRKYACFARMKLFLSGPNGEPMYTLNFVKGLYGDIILHSGSSIDSPPLAASGRQSSLRDDYLVTLPSLSGNGPQDEILRRPKGLKGRFWFAIQVGHGPDQHVERFEWRRSRGAEVKSVGQSRWGGYKLVRLGSTNTKEEYSSSEEDLHDGSTNGEGYTSDGKEVVAVWGSTNCLKSLSGVGEFQFRGSGATGELGQLWALMAVMSCMSIWQKVQRDNATAGASSSSAASASVAASA
ncbi:hypothetical protein FOYG_03468 [Fusarium oxysporum NRRL 32931]|uniref:Uncharacterized protein n=1 Tax=Fusarium oxysporum NRRL 32931 TaxID=660029 RepID=W9J3Q4_FUSOX|nr:hypothetical protein FOYG_03468 [Fusarium oxysporum NRRL 32931]